MAEAPYRSRAHRVPISLVERAGVRHGMAVDVADVLVTADLLGHTTHGLALLAPYLGEIERGTMTRSGEPDIVSDRPAAQTWDGRRLPGPWLTLRALDAAAKMAGVNGTGTVVIRRSHHIACLAVYLLRATERGLVAIVESSDPIVAAVVPHGGMTPVLTPNPIAAGLPTSGDPILIDTSSSITSMGFAKQEMQAGRKLPGAWVIDHAGNATDDPNALHDRAQGRAAAVRRPRRGIQGIRAGTARGSDDRRPVGPRPRRPARRLGRNRLRPGARSGGFWRAQKLRAADGAVAGACRDAKPRAGGARVRLPGEAG